MRFFPSLHFYAHKIYTIRKDDKGRRKFCISNNRDRPLVNGFTDDTHIYGKLFDVLK